MGRLSEALSWILPDITVEEYQTKRCIISRSAHGRPYIGVTRRPGLYIAGGCNGYSAMCSDGIGSVAAQVVSNDTFPEGFSATDFDIVYQT